MLLRGCGLWLSSTQVFGGTSGVGDQGLLVPRARLGQPSPHVPKAKAEEVRTGSPS